jgi:hypothetical protein
MSVIMGAISCRGNVRIFSSYWSDPDEPVSCAHYYIRLQRQLNSCQVVSIYQHEQQFDLTKPTDLIHLYVFCAKLRDSLQETLIPQLQQLGFPGRAHIERFRWRGADPVRKPSNKRTASSSISEV